MPCVTHTVRITPMPETQCCDLCNASVPIWTYPADDFDIDFGVGPIHRSVSAWAVCQECSNIIETAGRDALLERCVRVGSAILGIPSGELLPLIRPIFVGFFASRRGSRVLGVSPPAE